MSTIKSMPEELLQAPAEEILPLEVTETEVVTETEEVVRRDDAAVERLVVNNIGLAKSIARRTGSRDREAVMGDALLGLVKAARAFDETRGVQFSTYAFATMNGVIRHGYRDNWPMRVPRGMKEGILKVRDMEASLTQSLGRVPEAAEIAEKTNFAVAQVKELQLAYRTLNAIGSIERSSSGDDEKPGSGDFLADSASEADREYVELSMDLKQSLAKLPDRERRIIELRYFHEMTQQEIANIVGISQMHVSRLLAKAVAMLRHSILGEQTEN